MEKTRNKPKKLLPYGMLLTRLFKHVVSIVPELPIDHYISHDRVMHPLAPHYERKTQSDHGKKRPRELNVVSSSTTLNHPSSSHLLDDTIDENDDESFHSNYSSPSQNVSSSSNVVRGPPKEVLPPESGKYGSWVARRLPHVRGLPPSSFISTLLPSLFGASSNSTTLSLCLRTLEDAACGIDVASRTRVGLGYISLSSSYSSLKYSSSVRRSSLRLYLLRSRVLEVKVEAVIGGSSLTLGLDKGVRVEKPGGSVISLPFVMPEK
ncbi:hypothetical protein Tco_0378221 [Tanacetum coccineum]